MDRPVEKEQTETPMGANTVAVSVRRASVADVQANAGDMLRAHAEEAEPVMAERLAPDWHFYREAERAGRMIVLAAYANFEMVGYAVAAIVQSSHYMGHVFCQHDLLFVSKGWRNHRVGLQLIERLRVEARAAGAEQLLMHAKIGSRLEELLPRLGFEREETIFRRDLNA